MVVGSLSDSCQFGKSSVDRVCNSSKMYILPLELLRLLAPLTTWHRFDEPLRVQMQQQLQRMGNSGGSKGGGGGKKKKS